jgi:hypothetical protein
MNEDDNDSGATMEQIACDYGSSVVDLLIDIQESRYLQETHIPFIRHLNCLETNERQPTNLSRKQVNAFNNGEYVALSYTWQASDHEDSTSGLYQIQNKDRHRKTFDPSEVRNCVFDRILKYMQKCKIRLLWIDSHSLCQAVCQETDCNHEECKENRRGIEVMDLVYKFSRHPVALLSTPIKSRRKLQTLKRILNGDLVSYNQSGSGFRLSRKTNRQEVEEAIELLNELTRDPWWKRGWIFQEGYRAGRALSLLIPHSPDLKGLKQSLGYDLFKNIRGELCINATDFSYETTKLCLAYGTIKNPPPTSTNKIKEIIETAGRYTLLLGKHLSMSPTIFSDINKRELKRHWDQLAIAANCCQYSTRLNVQELKRKGHSFSLSKLALCLLNGELLRNDVVIGNPSQMTVLKFLSSQTFGGFYAPMGQRSLSFNKGCRLTDVELTRNGILTKGHLWKLGTVIRPQDIRRRLSWVAKPRGILRLDQRKRLAQLARTLRDFGYNPLAGQIWGFLDRDASKSGDPGSSDSFADSYMTTMASELADAIDGGLPLRLACIDCPEGRSEYGAIFLCEDDAMEDISHAPNTRYRVPQHVFTASAPRREGTATHAHNDLDRHVSLKVKRVGSIRETGQSIPRLQIRSWTLGLCFFRGVERTTVLFPWPPGFKAIAV